MLDAGDPAPDFLLPAAGDPDAEYMLSAAADAGPVVLAFLPAAETPALSLLEPLAGTDWGSLTDSVAVLAIGESPDVTRRLARRGLAFPVLLDDSGFVTDQYRVTRAADGVVRRALAVADQRCTIRFAWEASDPAERPPMSELRATVEGL